MESRKTLLHPETAFHIYNRGVNGAKVFYEEKNYGYFLQQYAKYVHPYVETFAYCLLSNHFHFFIRVLPDEQLEKLISKKMKKPTYWHVSNALSSFLQSYTRAMNKMYERTGHLFESPFRRIAVTDETYFSRLISYIHHNPEKHGLIEDFRLYPYSSYQAHLSDRPSRLKREEVLRWFGGREGYVNFHRLHQEDLIQERETNFLFKEESDFQ